jgi:hypothetical protein
VNDKPRNADEPYPPADLAAYGISPRPLLSFELKLMRALEHLHAAEARIEKFLEHDPGTTVLEQNQAKREMAFWYRAFLQPDPEIVPPVTDCIHNLRQALDHLAYRLAIAVSGSDPPPNAANTGFPIYDDPGMLTDDRLSNFIGRPTSIPQEMRAALERAQPYSGGDAKLLAILRELDDLDKHRFPPLVTVGGFISEVDIAQLPAEWVVGPKVGPIENGAEIMRWGLKPGTSYVDMKFRCTNHVAFGKPSPAEGREPHVLLRETREYIRKDVIPSFAPFLWPRVQGQAMPPQPPP